MSEWIVYSKDGQTERCRLKSIEYNGSFMNERTVTATFDSSSEVDFDVFDYITYRGEQFELEAIPTVKKISEFDYEYELRFVSHKYELERCEMRDIVPSDNGIVYPTPLTFSFTGDVRYLAERIQACLDSLYGSGVWNIIIADGVKSEEQNITISQQNCWNALSLVNTTYGLNFYIKGRTVTIGGEQSLLSHTFQYGKGNGLYEIERVADTETGIVTKLRAYGSTRNLDYSYPKRPEWADSALGTSFVLSPLRLMLPSFKTDGKTDYILADESVIAEYGIREASVIFEDIYPSITGATNGNGQSIDEIKSVEPVDDESSTFVVYIYDLGFDLEEHLTTSDAQISMKSGAMQGYTFNIAQDGIEKQSDNSYKITLGRITTDSSDTGNYNIPNSSWNMSKGDKFVFLNILMPKEYIRNAEERLLARAKEYLEEYGKTHFSYNIGLHDKFLIENNEVYSKLIEGARLKIYDYELGISEDVTIQSLTITENAEENILPQVKVTLNNKPSASTLERIQGQIKELSDSASGNFSSQSELLQQYRKKLDKPFFDRLFVAISEDGNEIPSTDLVSPIAYIKAKHNFAASGGITAYTEDSDMDIPSIYDGLPIDNKTIYWVETTTENGTKVKVLKSKAGDGEGGSSNFENVKESGSGNAFTYFTLSEDKKTLTLVKGDTFAKQSDYETLNTKVSDFLEGEDTDTIINKWKELETFLTGMKESDDLAKILSNKAEKEELKKYVTLDGAQEITGEKNFTGGLSVNGSPIVYNKEEGYWMLTGDLLVTGGLTSYVNDGTHTPSTITDAVNVDWETIIKDDNGNLALNPDIDFGGGASNWDDLEGKPSWITESKPEYNYSEIKGTPDLSKYALSSSLVNYQTKIDSTNKLAYSLISGTPDLSVYALKTQIPSLSGYATQSWVNEQGFSTQTWVGNQGYATQTWVGNNYLPKTGGTLTGSLRLQNGNYGTTLYFGDSSYCYISEPSDDRMTIYASSGITLSSNSTITMSCSGLSINGGSLNYSSSTWTMTGNLAVTGGLTFYSDIRKKTKIKDVELTLDQIADAPLIEHYYNDDKSKTTHVSSIAQYWAETIGNDWFCKKDSEGYYTMEIQNCALASAISIAREFREYRQETESVMREMEDCIRELKKEVESLKEKL